MQTGPAGNRSGPRLPERKRTWFVAGLSALLVLAGVGLWLVIASKGDNAIVAPDVEELVTSTSDVRAELGNLTAELQDLILTSRQGEESLETAVAASGDLVERADNLTTSFLALPTSPDESLTKQLYLASSRTLAESARTLTLVGTSPEPAVAAKLVDMAGRVMLIGSALRASADESLVALQSGTSFVVVPGDVPSTAELSRFPPGVPLDGLPEDRTIPDPDVDEAIQGNGDWVEAASPVMSAYAAETATMGDGVRSFETDGQGTVLAQGATTWYDAASQALDELSAMRRPDTLQAADVALRNALWLGTEAARAFGAAGARPELAADLLATGKALRLTSDGLWAAAAGRVDRETGEALPGPPATGFDLALVDPEKRAEPAPVAPVESEPASDTGQ
jgi:hypothetical protein